MSGSPPTPLTRRSDLAPEGRRLDRSTCRANSSCEPRGSRRAAGRAAISPGFIKAARDSNIMLLFFGSGAGRVDFAPHSP